MVNHPVLEQNELWQALISLENLQKEVIMQDFLDGHTISRSQFRELENFLLYFNVKVEITEKDGVEILLPLADLEKIQVNFSLAEWLALAAHFPLMEHFKGKAFNQSVSTLFGNVEKKHPDWDLFRALHLERQVGISRAQNTKKRDGITTVIDDCLGLKIPVLTWSGEKQSIDIFPHKIIYLEGSLCLVGEDIKDKIICSLALDQVDKAQASMTEYKPHYGPVEINQFISMVRSLSGKEERLVLKIISPGQVELSPKYHFLGNPYVTLNYQGAMIWAATVEKGPELFNWLYSIRSSIEILDPSDLASEFSDYCRRNEENTKKIA